MSPNKSVSGTGCSGLVHWDDPEGWYGEGGGRGVQDGEHVYTHGCMAKPIQYCKVISLQLKYINLYFKKGRGTRGQIANIHWIIKKAREFQINIYFCFIDYAKAFDCVDHNEMWKILQEMGISDHLTCLRRNQYAGQEVTVRTVHGTTDWFPIGKGVRQGCILSPCLFNLYAEYIMKNAGLEEAQAGINIAGRNINNLRYADDITLMAESEEELKTLLMKVKEESKNVGLKLKIKIRKLSSWHLVPSLHGIWSHHFMANSWGNSGNSG